MNFQTTRDSKIESARCCVLFDPKDGTIHHTHRVLTMQGAQGTSKQQMEARTLHHAKERGLDTKRLHILHVDPEALATPGHYSVNPKTRVLVKRETRPTGRRRAPRKRK
jgi:hypothetical protein